MNRPYIAFEGIEGAGKSTVAQRVGARLEADGLRVVRVREPGGTTVGESIRQILLSHELAPETVDRGSPLRRRPGPACGRGGGPGTR